MAGVGEPTSTPRSRPTTRRRIGRRTETVYDEHMRAPMEELLAELEPEFGSMEDLPAYRDVRFSRDKSPYKTHIGATIGQGYVQLDAHRLAVGAGMWEMAADQLERYRRVRGRRQHRRGARNPRRVGPRRGAHGDGPRRAEDGAAGLPEGPSEDRAAAVQGPRRVARVAGRPLARERRSEGSHRRVLLRMHGPSSTGSATNVGPPDAATSSLIDAGGY